VGVAGRRAARKRAGWKMRFIKGKKGKKGNKRRANRQSRFSKIPNILTFWVDRAENICDLIIFQRRLNI
jgi:hypothetical protein